MKDGSAISDGAACGDLELARIAAAETEGKPASWMQIALHDLCQPLMALECLLYVNREAVPEESLDASLLRNVMVEGLVECGRMMALVRAMQERVSAGEEVPEE
jgi:phosphoglycerate-specific signal transduction histidine kinase